MSGGIRRTVCIIHIYIYICCMWCVMCLCVSLYISLSLEPSGCFCTMHFVLRIMYYVLLCITMYYALCIRYVCTCVFMSQNCLIYFSSYIYIYSSCVCISSLARENLTWSTVWDFKCLGPFEIPSPAPKLKISNISPIGTK